MPPPWCSDRRASWRPRRARPPLPLGFADEARDGVDRADRLGARPSRSRRAGRPARGDRPSPARPRVGSPVRRSGQLSPRRGRGGSIRTPASTPWASSSGERTGQPFEEVLREFVLDAARDGRDGAPRAAVAGAPWAGRRHGRACRGAASAAVGRAWDCTRGDDASRSRAWSASCPGSDGSIRATGVSGPSCTTASRRIGWADEQRGDVRTLRWIRDLRVDRSGGGHRAGDAHRSRVRSVGARRLAGASRIRCSRRPPTPHRASLSAWRTRMEIGPGIRRLGKGLVNSYLVETGGEVTIVDAGAPSYLGDLPRELAAMGRTLDDVRAVVLTHGHSDHIGFAERIRRERQYADPRPRARRGARSRRGPEPPRASARSRSRRCCEFLIFSATHRHAPHPADPARSRRSATARPSTCPVRRGSSSCPATRPAVPRSTSPAATRCSSATRSRRTA